MHCPKCGKENPDDAQSCISCGCSLKQAPMINEGVNVRVSRMAAASFVCAILGLALILPSLIAINYPRVISARSEVTTLTFLLSLLTLTVAIILGFVSIVRIEQGGGKITGREFAVAAVLLAVFGGLLPVWFIIKRRPRSTAYRMVCGTNLSRIGRAMMMYSNDYDEELPRASGRNSVWAARIHDWKADNRFGAYNLNSDGSSGQVSISSSFYLLIKHAEVKPESFVCNKDYKTTEFVPAKYGAGDRGLVELWDFGPEPSKHYSYSYHMPYGPYALNTSSEPGMAVAADRNPWMASAFVKAKKDFSKFNPDGGREAVKAGNAVAHKADGQNVLFLDTHVFFEKWSFCGIKNDNIYTYWDGDDIRCGTPPKLGSQPADKLDSMLVHNPPVTNKK